jgi:hypothetical protein
MYIYGEFYVFVIIFTNISILLFYRRIFGVNPMFKRLSTVVIVLHVLWAIPGFLVETFVCTPVNTMWADPLAMPEKCIFYSTYWMTMMVIELLLDVIVLALPIHAIAKLKLSWKKKCGIAAIFMLGAL